MENKTILIWVVINLLLLVGCCFVVVEWYEITRSLKYPCLKCVTENPELKPCIFQGEQKFKINISDYVKP